MATLINEEFYTTFKNYVNENKESLNENIYAGTGHAYNPADKTKINNQNGNEILNGIYVEIQKDPTITTEEAMMRVSRNLAKDENYYISGEGAGQFGIEGVKYEKQSQEMKAEGEYAASGYGETLGVTDNQYEMIKDLTETIIQHSGINIHMMTDEQIKAQAGAVINEILTITGLKK